MTTISIEEAGSRLSELIHRLAPGEEIVITEGDRPVARLIPLKGTVLSMEHFDDPLEVFEESM
ncbi:MAG: type II toxin-antitoxin system Phd/YefM family antitoxin [Isosphaeraceae bacterium]